MPLSAPPLNAAAAGPRIGFESTLTERRDTIEAWFERQWQLTTPPFYCSVDLRNAGYKLAPVDTNLFPGGFNNLDPAQDGFCVEALRAALSRVMESCCRVLLVPESHTRNLFYLRNVIALQRLLIKAGYEVRIGSLSPDITAPTIADAGDGSSLLLEPLQRSGNRVGLVDFDPCVVLLNNDLAGGRPEILEDIEQKVIPPLGVGWSDRLKTQHFGFYREVAAEFGAVAGFDPWWVDPLFRNCGQINFLKREGEECLVANVEMLLEDMRAKYAEYGVTDEPFAIVKADAGTYGMGVMTVRNVEEVTNLNRDARKKMAASKGGKSVSGAIIQEGVYSFEKLGEENATAEPVIYMIDRFVVGGFYRTHSGRSNQENLNAPGARFLPLSTSATSSDDEPGRRFYAYSIVARLALLAAAREIAAVNAATERALAVA